MFGRKSVGLCEKYPFNRWHFLPSNRVIHEGHSVFSCANGKPCVIQMLSYNPEVRKFT